MSVSLECTCKLSQSCLLKPRELELALTLDWFSGYYSVIAFPVLLAIPFRKGWENQICHSHGQLIGFSQRNVSHFSDLSPQGSRGLNWHTSPHTARMRWGIQGQVSFNSSLDIFNSSASGAAVSITWALKHNNAIVRALKLSFAKITDIFITFSIPPFPIILFITEN